jgi:tripartite-type tricarboxylate transporter receptor subunit TctC
MAARLNREVNEMLNTAEMKDTLAQQGFVGEPGPPESLTAQIRADIAKWREVIPKAGISAQ